jgi:protein SCO1
MPRIRLVRRALLAGLAVLAGCEPLPESAPPVQGYRGIATESVLEKPRVVLTDTEGRPFDFVRDTEGRVALLFFGYTECPDICPVHMTNLGAVLNDLPRDMRERFVVVFVTTDPEHDTPERMREWLDRLGRGFVGLTGSQVEVEAMQRELGLPVAVKIEREKGQYTVAHAAQILAFTRDGTARIQYPFGTRQADWAHDLPRLAEEEWAER